MPSFVAAIGHSGNEVLLCIRVLKLRFLDLPEKGLLRYPRK
jgi:hypothetical protein